MGISGAPQRRFPLPGEGHQANESLSVVASALGCGLFLALTKDARISAKEMGAPVGKQLVPRRIFGIHEYVLKPGVDENKFERALRQAEKRGLLRLPGLVDHYFLKGLKGHRRGTYAAIWVFESREAWESLWGTPDHPISKQDYPANWKVWEDEVLAAFLDRDPDAIRLTDYEQL